jgi:hypothetical protein
MTFTNLANAAAFLVPSASANVRGEDHDLRPYLHHNLRNLKRKKGMMKGGMMGRKGSKDSKDTTPTDLEQFPQWATEEGYW